MAGNITKRGENREKMKGGPGKVSDHRRTLLVATALKDLTQD